jgi:hypothetical protein
VLTLVVLLQIQTIQSQYGVSLVSLTLVDSQNVFPFHSYSFSFYLFGRSYSAGFPQNFLRIFWMNRHSTDIEHLLPKKEDRFKELNEWKDLWAAVLFAVAFGGFIVISGYGIGSLGFESSPEGGNGSITGNHISNVVLVSLAMGLSLSVIYYTMMKE